VIISRHRINVHHWGIIAFLHRCLRLQLAIHHPVSRTASWFKNAGEKEESRPSDVM
jgi:hypothetical protein